MKPVVTAAEMRGLDRATIEEVGIPAFTLMETAGRAVAQSAATLLSPEARGPKPEALQGRHRVAVICGPGNNGGDGFVAARVLREMGHEAVVYLAVPRGAIKGDALAHLCVLERAGGLVRMIDTPKALDDVGDAIDGADLAIDALFGIGPVRPIEGHLADVVACINRCERRLAVDIPSGMDADTGRVGGACVDAQRTVTMGALKIALASSPGFARCGVVDVADIGIPRALVAAQVVHAGLVEAADVASWLPVEHPLDHKGRRGHVLVVGGMPGFRGAGRLAAEAALRAGAGLVTLATAGEVTAPDSAMTRALSTNLGEVLAGKAAVVIGPGLGQSEPAAGWLGEVLASGVPAVLDADALNLTAGVTEVLAKASGPIVITPHPGEAARLLGTTPAEIEADRLAAARQLATRTHAVVVLKGARTIVCDGTLGDEFCWINPTGGPALATGGTGDVLSGVIGALLAQGASAVDAARAAVYLHGLAGERLAEVHGPRGVVSSDLPAAIAGVRREIPRLA